MVINKSSSRVLVVLCKQVKTALGPESTPVDVTRRLAELWKQVTTAEKEELHQESMKLRDEYV